ncbi:MAG: ParB/RepB/Spo0J family partition protein [Candidatus Competibacteraceae bacterium]
MPWPTPQAVALARIVGFVEPVTVRPLLGATPQRYEILTGLRHWLLAQRAQLATVDIHLRESLSDDAAHQLVALDAGQEWPNPITEAEAVQAGVNEGLSITAAGRVVGLSRTEASHRLRLLQLVPSVRTQVATGALETGKARALVGLAEEAQIELVQRIVWERLTTRQVEALAQEYKHGHRPVRTGTGTPRTLPTPDPNLVRLETDLAERLGTQVTISCGEGSRGQLVIDFANLDILDGVLECLGYKP